MASLMEKKFFFVSQGAMSNAFSVVSFTGDEGLSTPYRFEITLATTFTNIDVNRMLNSTAIFYFGTDNALPVHGVLANFEQLYQVGEYIFYKAVLVPRIWKLNLYSGSRVFINTSVEDNKNTIPNIIMEVLTKTDRNTNMGVLGSSDLVFSLNTVYKEWPFVCQYQENYLNFISRWMERDGLYYFFEQDNGVDKLVVTDNYQAHTDLPQMPTVKYSPISGLSYNESKEVVTSFNLRQKPVPHTVIVRDFNYRNYPPEVSGTYNTPDQQGEGEVYLYGENVLDNTEANSLARIRHEELACRKQIYYGEGSVFCFRSGYSFTLQNHYQSDFNRKYLIVNVHHEGSQASFLTAGIDKNLSEKEKVSYYSNSFEVINYYVQFRAERKTPKPRFYGTINATVNTNSDDAPVLLDGDGRYKVTAPFDRVDLGASTNDMNSVPMAQPYSGQNYGIHFPLHKDADVMLSFVDGDPDRPIIAGALPDKLNQDSVLDLEQSISRIRTQGGHFLELDDNDLIAYHKRVLLHSDASLWIEANRYAEYFGKRLRQSDILPTSNTPDVPADLIYLYNQIYAIDGELRPDNMARHNYMDDKPVISDSDWNSMNDGQRWEALLNTGRVQIIKGDVFLVRDSNVYDFLAYNYSFGCAYKEDHIDEKAATINLRYSRYWPDKDDSNASKGHMTKKQMEVGIFTGLGIGTVLAVGYGIWAGILYGTFGTTTSGILTGLLAWFLGEVVIGGVLTGAGAGIGAALGATGEYIQQDIGDLQAGPDAGELKTWAENVGSSYKHDSNDNLVRPLEQDISLKLDKRAAKKKGKSKGKPMDSETTFIEKKYGDTYEFTWGNTIEITHGDKEEHTCGDAYEYQYGGIREESKFNSKGYKTSWERCDYDDMVSEEAHWDAVTGTCVEYKYSNHGHFEFAISPPTFPKLAIDISLSSLNAEISLSAGMKIEAKASAALELNLAVSIGFSIEFEVKRGGELKWNEVSGKMEFESFGMEAQKKAALDAAVQELVIKSAKLSLGQNNLKLEKGELKLNDAAIHLQGGGLLFQGM